ncbi:hypothetical protein DR79_1394 [Francisella tularensis]|nr:hypothetical protein DR85_1838 [Francisella tularensis]KFJ43082.1 hypothetical protein DR79_1394 [Francisella tularensis]
MLSLMCLTKYSRINYIEMCLLSEQGKYLDIPRNAYL